MLHEIPTATFFLIAAFEKVLRFFHDQGGFSWGWSIVVLTVCVRIVLLPLTLKQMKSMQRMAQLQPELKALQARYKDDKQRLQQETMKYYRENEVNPLASCLPLAAQLPVFFSLYFMLRRDLRHDICPAINPPTRHNPIPCGASEAAHFLGISDITAQATGLALAALLVLYVVTQLLSGVLSTMTADRSQRFLVLGMPLIFVGFIQRFPAGLIVYWITTNLWTVVQGIIVRRTVPMPKPPPRAPGESGGLFAALGLGGGSDGGSGGLLGGLLSPKPTGPAGGDGGRSNEPSSRGDGDGAARGNGGKADGSKRKRPPAGARSARGGGPPPPSPRKRKKRSGRRR